MAGGEGFAGVVAVAELLVIDDFRVVGLRGIGPDSVEDTAANVQTQEQHQAQDQLGRMNRNSETAEEVGEREVFPPIDITEGHLRIVRHETDLLSPGRHI